METFFGIPQHKSLRSIESQPKILLIGIKNMFTRLLSCLAHLKQRLDLNELI